MMELNSSAKFYIEHHQLPMLAKRDIIEVEEAVQITFVIHSGFDEPFEFLVRLQSVVSQRLGVHDIRNCNSKYY